MAKMYIMGKYSEKAFLGFLKDPTTDRKAAVEKLTSAAGGKMISMDIVRGPYDFIVVAEMADFETFAAAVWCRSSTLEAFQKRSTPTIAWQCPKAI